MSVLDVGCNAGFFALEMKRRGAAEVVAVDSDPRYLAQARLASEVSGLPLDLRQLSVYDVARLGRRFDLVIFLGVLYHLRHPLLALDLLREHVVGDRLLFQSSAGRGPSRRRDVRRLSLRRRAALLGSRRASPPLHRANATPATRPTGGSRTAHAPRPCSAPPASTSAPTPIPTCGCAGSGRTDPRRPPSGSKNRNPALPITPEACTTRPATSCNPVRTAARL